MNRRQIDMLDTALKETKDTHSMLNGLNVGANTIDNKLVNDVFEKIMNESANNAIETCIELCRQEMTIGDLLSTTLLKRLIDKFETLKSK